MANVTRARIPTFWDAGDAPENDAERAAQYVGGLARRKEKGLPRGEFKTQREKLELHLSRYYTKNQRANRDINLVSYEMSPERGFSGAGASPKWGKRFRLPTDLSSDRMEDRPRSPVLHGAFCYAVLQGMQIVESLEFSNAMATLNGTAPGARGGICGGEEVRAPMARAERRSHPSFGTHE